jgi:general secretion pathway protein G
MWLPAGGILVLGILVTVLVQSIRGTSDHARRARARADISDLEIALDRYHTDNHNYPSTSQGLSALVSSPDTGPIPSNYEQGGYLTVVPKDPWGNNYFYRSDGNSYTLKSLGADGMEGGSGPNADIDASHQ